MFLKDILDTRRSRNRPEDIDHLRGEADQAAPPRGFARALASIPFPAVVAEIKRASPSRGDLRPHLDPAELARAYERGGAAALSVLTEVDHFKGSLDDLRKARQATTLPVLRKDFLLEPWEIYESRAAGADAVLLIASALPVDRLAHMHRLAHQLGMDTLVEVHNLEELEQVLTVEPRVVGINNRDLHSFAVDLSTTRSLATHLPSGVLKVSESGLSCYQDLASLQDTVDAFLIGESLVTAADPEVALRKLRGEGAAIS